MLLKYRLMSIVPLLFLFRVEVITLGIGVPNVVLVELLPLFLLNFLHLSLRLLLQLVSEWHEQVALPNIELRLESVIFAHG